MQFSEQGDLLFFGNSFLPFSFLHSPESLESFKESSLFDEIFHSVSLAKHSDSFEVAYSFSLVYFHLLIKFHSKFVVDEFSYSLDVFLVEVVVYHWAFSILRIRQNEFQVSFLFPCHPFGTLGCQLMQHVIEDSVAWQVYCAVGGLFDIQMIHVACLVLWYRDLGCYHDC